MLIAPLINAPLNTPFFPPQEQAEVQNAVLKEYEDVQELMDDDEG